MKAERIKQEGIIMGIIQDVIKYEGDNSTIIFKHPAEDFNTLSKLIVHESQEAVFFSDGQALDSFGAGKYTLETGNIPLISILKNLVTGGISQFHVEVYFINLTSIMDIIWGTPSQVTVKDPNYGFNYNAGASGSFGIRVIDGRKLLIKYVGTEQEMTVEHVKKYFKDLVATRVKNCIAVELGKYSFNEINGHLNDISSKLLEQIRLDIEPFGVEIFNFFVSNIAVAEDDLLRLKELDNSMAEKKFEAMGNRDANIIEAEGIARARNIQGYTWQEERQFDVSNKFAENEGFAANPANMMAQVPVAFAMGGMINRSISSSYQQQAGDYDNSMNQNANMMNCPNCGTMVSRGSKFCHNCGGQLQINSKAFCSNCGMELSAKSRFCPNCGNKRG